MRALHKLSARFVSTVTAAGRHSDGGGLYLAVSTDGRRRWVFLFKWRGKTVEMGLGSARDISLVRARERAAEARGILADGLSPLEARRQDKTVPTFGEAADALIESMAPSWRNDKHAAQWRMTLGKYAAPIRGISVAAVSTDDVLSLLKPMWSTKPETASRLRGRIESVLDAARAHGHRSTENCARWRGHLDKLLPPKKKLSRGHHAAMPYADLPAFVAKLREAPTVSNLALEFAILAAARSGEAMGATWPEVDEVARLWTVPAERMKGGRPHQVPLTDRMLEILRAVNRLKPDPRLVFPGQRSGEPLSTMALAMAMRRAGTGHFTPHGMRSAFRDWVGDETDFSRETAELALAHTVRDATEAAYRRRTSLDKRRRLLDAWAAFLDGHHVDNVISIAAAR